MPSIPIAIVGMSCRFSGGASNPQKLWDLVAQGRSAWSKIPASRYNSTAFYHPHPEKLGTSNVEGGYFLEEDVSYFDLSFFSFSAEVAACMDPQIRIQLELVYEALEDAGIPLSKIAGTNTSCFAGTFIRDYHDLLMRDPATLPRHFTTGNFTAMVANRISHFFDLRGPSTSVDTGCSTSLTALHLACQTIRTGESDCSIVGGACVMSNPDMFCQLSSLGFIGIDGKSYSFDHRAQGYGRGEGVATLVLKRLDDAIRDRDPIRAVIRETGLNQDGKTPTLTSPSGEAQESLMRDCYRRAGLNPLDTTYVETHGTGTKKGDPIETTAIGKVFGRPSTIEPLLIGSIKSNIGHTEAASGIASIIKVAMAFENRQIPPSINFEKPNPLIDFTNLGIQPARSLEPWPECDIRRASISNFGYGGSNTHVIMEDAAYHREDPPMSTEKYATPRKVFILSARDREAASTMRSKLKDYILAAVERSEDIDFSDLAYTLDQRRSKFSWTTAITAGTVGELIDGLKDATLKPSSVLSKPRVGFVFNGQGAQWHAMGRELMQTYPVYTETLQEADAVIKSFGSTWSVVGELSKESDHTRVNEVTFSFPLSCVVQLALVRLLSSWGIKPSAVTGHSSGEVAAAFAAGALSFKEAIAVTYFRGLLTDQYVVKAKSQGGMLAVGLGAAEVNEYLGKPLPGKVVVACENSPSSVTLSGDVSAIDALEVLFRDRKIFARKLKVAAAYHSHHMLPIAEGYHAALSENMDLKGSFGDVLFSSPVSGSWISDVESLGPSHWVENMMRPVLFTQSLSNMIAGLTESNPLGQNVDFLVEIGPHGALSGPIRQNITHANLKHLKLDYGSCLTRGQDAVSTIQQLAALLVCRGYPVDLANVNFPKGLHGLKALPSLPSYPWNHTTKFWAEPRVSREHRFRKHASHDLLGVRVPGANPFSPSWRHIIRTGDIPWVRDHEVQSNIVYPGAGCIAMAIEAMRQLSLDEGKTITGYNLRDIQITRALVIPDTPEGIEVQLTLSAPDDKALMGDWRNFHVYSALSNGEWAENCSGYIAVAVEHVRNSINNIPPEASKGHLTSSVEPSALFKKLHQAGVRHGPSFQNLMTIEVGHSKSRATFKVPDTASLMPSNYQSRHVIHPITLDAVFQVAYSTLTVEQQDRVGAAVPRSITTMYISEEINSNPGDVLIACSDLLHVDRQGFETSILVTGTDSVAPLLQIGDMHYRSLGLSLESQDEEEVDLCLTVNWVPSLDHGDLQELHGTLSYAVDIDEKIIGEDLTRATYHFIHDTINALSDEDISGLKSHHATWLDWMRRIEAQAMNNELAPKSSKWPETSDGVKQMLYDRVASHSVNGQMLVRLGKHFVNIMRNKVEPLEIMMEGQLLYKFYREMLHFTRSILQAVELLKVYSRQHPCANILEIGAGTGSCTGPALYALGGNTDNSKPQFAHYEFTDISSGFFGEARKNFAAWGDLVTYRTLDIEKSPEEQSFQLATYDVIIACLVLHATKDIDNTMRNVRSLLKPGGKLILVETTQDSIDVNMIFGSLPGWWLSQESERKHSPNLNLDMWKDVLPRTGFSGIDFDVWDCEDAKHRSMSVILSTAVPENVVQFPTKISLIHSDDTPPEAWLRTLCDAFQKVTGSVPMIERLEDLRSDGKACVFVTEMSTPTLSKMNETQFEAIKGMVGNSKGLLWVTRGATGGCVNPELSLHSGLLRVRRVEDAAKKYISLDLDPSEETFTVANAHHIASIFRHTFDESRAGDEIETEYATRASRVLIPRVRFSRPESEDALNPKDRPAELQPFQRPDRRLRMFVDTPGSLDSILFKTDPQDDDYLPCNFVEIEGKAFGLNFRDVMVAMGQLKEKNMGFECGGVITRVGSAVSDFEVGDRVCALTAHGHWASRSRVPSTSCARIPPSMSFETAASIPMVFLTAYYSLFEAGRLERGESVLIHAASGGVGQAAIMLASLKGAEIFATVSTKEKREFLKHTYHLDDDHIFSSRTASFATDLKVATGGRGVDIVLNSLAAPYGRFIELGKRDIQSNKRLEMQPFGTAVSFVAFDLIHLSDYRPAVVSRMLNHILQLLGEGLITTISPIKVSPISDIVRAFRTMQAGKHVGKIVLRVGEEDVVSAVPDCKHTRLSPDVTYLLVGGVGGIGRSLARWFVAHGARYLLLLSRNAASRSESEQLIESLKADGCIVLVKNCDIADKESLATVVRDCGTVLPPIKGLVQGAMVLQDSIWERMTFAKWRAAVSPKVAGSYNLHAQFADSLDFFIMLSSVAGFIGNASQANYAAGNTYQDALARHRTSLNLPAVSIDLGLVKEIGYVSENKELGERLLRDGHRALEEKEVLDLVSAAIRNPYRALNASQIITGLLPIAVPQQTQTGWRADPRFVGLKQQARSKSGMCQGYNTATGTITLSLKDQIGGAESEIDAVNVLTRAIVAKLAEMFLIPEVDIDVSLPLAKYGVDSLVAVEMRNWLVAATRCEVSIFDILGCSSLRELAGKVSGSFY
ncbi:putative polyketide synthase [Pseudovirgaria hyperparasitica]|uniref:Putative polyketide synthase n=1 Tax=Pseudovirgaria hyperparasitica TaxID=470096 RepID=A0A6A6VT72_9PEZI|nr:putative polyketide synthase [Pseudovirgaria hyperparasitica]KAF2753079.1 putative polyketide synthase [Pseudovirgaria hyperparasitica]